MRRRRLKKSNAIAEINVVPFIDVMLVLLVIFMVAAPLLTTGIKVQLPQAASKPIQPAKPWVISLAKNSEVYINHKKITGGIRKMQQLIKHRLQTNSKQQFLVQANKNSKYSQVAKILATMQEVGVTSIGILTKST